MAGGCIAEWIVLPDMQIPIGKTFEFSKLNWTVDILKRRIINECLANIFHHFPKQISVLKRYTRVLPRTNGSAHVNDIPMQKHARSVMQYKILRREEVSVLEGFTRKLI